MRKLIDQIKLSLNNKKGETLIESITSVLLFTMLLLTIGAIITVSVKINANTNAKGSALQDAVNKIRTEVPSIGPSTEQITFTPVGAPAIPATAITQTIEIADNTENIIAFTPVLSP